MVLLRVFLISLIVMFSDHAAAEASDDPNLMMLDAIELYEDGMATSDDRRQRLLAKVDAILKRIERDHPNSIPATFLKKGTPLGPIDIEVLSAALSGSGTELPETTQNAIRSVAARACAASDCMEELRDALVEYFLELGFMGVDASAEMVKAIDAEKLRWLFSNPGQLGGNLERVNAFAELVDNTDFIDGLDRRLAERVRSEVFLDVAGNIAKEAAKDFTIKLVTNVATEVVANKLEQQGRAEEAAIARRWVEPSVDITLITKGATSASLASAGAGAAVIWAKNAYSLVQLGQKSIAAEASGATKEQQLAKIGEAIYSLDFSLRTGVVSGPMFREQDQGTVLTARMAETFQATLEQNYELQRWWLASDEAILLESFNSIIGLAKGAAGLVDKVISAIPESDPGQPSGLEVANSTNALPGGINLGGSEEKENEGIVFGIPTPSVTNSEKAIDTNFATACSRPNERPENLACPIVQEQICIGEGCIKSGAVRTNRILPLVAEPGSSTTSYETSKNETLAIVSSQVISLPCRAAANGIEGVPDGTVIFLVSYRGEGTYHYWRNGRLHLTTGSDLPFNRAYDSKNMDTRCFATPQKVSDWTNTWSLESEWWLELTSRAGETGWLNVSDLDWGGVAEPPVSGLSHFGGTGMIDTPDWVSSFLESSVNDQGLAGSEHLAKSTRSLPRCSAVGETLSSSEVMGAFGGKTIAIVFDDPQIATFKYRVGLMKQEGQFTSYQYIAPGGFSATTDQARVMNGKFCELNKRGEFCSSVERCDSGEVLFVLTPFSGDASYVQSIFNSADSDASTGTTVEELRQKPEILQRKLNRLGYDVGAIDGYPGPQTRQALMGFQVENCLPPTGQPDIATAIALIDSNGLVAPCAGARLPVGIEADTPLKEGIYVDTPALCNAESVPFETAYLQQRIVRGSSITWGQEGGCQTHRTDIRDGVTLFRGTCHGGNASSESAWRFDVLSNEAFIDLDMPMAMPHDALPRRFTKCSDESTLRVTWDAWFN